MKSQTAVRLAPWVLLIGVAYAVGHWRGAESSRAQAGDESAARTTPAADHEQALLAELAAIAEAARYMSEPDARTHAFFENLAATDLEAVFRWIEAMPAGNEQDAIFVMLMRRWGLLDSSGALARVAEIANLNTRVQSRAVIYESWGRQDPDAAYAHARTQPEGDEQMRAFNALLIGAAVKYPGGAITMWEGAPEAFRNSATGRATLERMVDAAYGTGQREAVQAIILGLPEGEERVRLCLALAKNWGTHHPDDTLEWLKKAMPSGPPRDAAGDAAFDAYARRNPEAAAAWALRNGTDARRGGYLAAAIAAWAPLDSRSAEIWMNEQADGNHLDGATYAMAAHFIERRNLARAFAWIRRITRGEARAELMGSLGEIWNAERPEEFKKFLGETSLSRLEVEMLLSKIDNTPPA